MQDKKFIFSFMSLFFVCVCFVAIPFVGVCCFVAVPFLWFFVSFSVSVELRGSVYVYMMWLVQQEVAQQDQQEEVVQQKDQQDMVWLQHQEEVVLQDHQDEVWLQQQEEVVQQKDQQDMVSLQEGGIISGC